MYTGCSKNVFA